MPVREHSATFTHPEYLRVPGPVRQLVDDPATRVLADGDGLLGWAGDRRLALYLNRQQRLFELWRLEADGVYRQALSLPADVVRGPDAVGLFVGWLLSHDRNRGYDIKASVDAHNERVEAEHERLISEQIGPMAEKLAWAVEKDLG